MKVDDVYSFNNIYVPTPFECIKQHFAKMAYVHGRGSTVQNNTSMIAETRQVYSIKRRKVEIRLLRRKGMTVRKKTWPCERQEEKEIPSMGCVHRYKKLY